MAAEFVHLHAHTQFSFLTSTAKVDALVTRAVELGMPGIAMTDHASMFGAIRHYKACHKAGITPILGCEVNVRRSDGSSAVDHLVLLAASNEGYQNLIRVVSHGHLQSVSESHPAVSLEQIAASAKGIVALTGCLGGVVSQALLEQGESAASQVLGRLKEVFEPGYLFVELQNHGLPEQPVVCRMLANLARAMELPTVATNDVHFIGRDDGQAQLYLECVRLGRTYAEAAPAHHGSYEMYLKSAEEMAAALPEYPEALRNTLRVAEMCSDLHLTLGKPMLPHFQVPEGYDTERYFRYVAEKGLEKRCAQLRGLGVAVDEAVYRERLRRELDVIVGMQYPGYFLIVWDFIREAKSRGIPVGPGRGSGAGSLVAYAMEITELDPLPYDLLFERFLNPERVSMPDFDVDFCMSRREEVIQYVSQRYGKESVGQIATFQNLKARSVTKDVARAMGILAPEAQRIATLIPEKGQGKTCTIEEALDVEPKLKELHDSDPRVAELLKQARKLEGLTRHAGMHAAGVVISEGPLYDHVPCFLSDAAIVTQYDKDDVELAGLVKFDFLGLKTLTVIDIAEKLVGSRPDRQGRPLVLSQVRLDDDATYALISSGETTGVFQLESSGMQQLLRGLKPDCFEDVVAVVALYRPGPLGTGMVDDFVASKHRRKEVRKLHPLVDDVLRPTYGVPVYQEQVMQIAQKLAGYSLGGADLLRRAMGKKKIEEMAKQQEQFVQGAVVRGVSAEQATAIFKEIEGFASYGFNKSHSAAYALITYQTAYLKTHYPTEFFAALMTADKDKIEKVVRIIAEARAWGVSVLPPDANLSEMDFTVVYGSPNGDGLRLGSGKLKDRFSPQIRFGLGAVRGLGESALEAVFAARSAGGPFRDLFDFAARVDSKRLNKGVIEALVQCGAFDQPLANAGISRARAFAAADHALERSRSASRDRERGQTTLFGMFDQAEPKSSGGARANDGYPDCEEWDRLTLLRREKAALGCYVSGHPLHRYGAKLGRIDASPTSSLATADPWSVASVAGMVENYQERLFKGGSGGKAAFFEIEDAHGRVKAKLRGDRMDAFSGLLTSGDPVLISGKVSFPISDEPDEEKEPTLLVDGVELLSAAVLKATRGIAIRLVADAVHVGTLKCLREVLQACPGSCSVELVLELSDGIQVVLSLDELRVTPDDRMLASLERLFGGTVAELR